MDYITKWSFDRIWKKGNADCGFPDPVKLREGKITKRKKRFPLKNSTCCDAMMHVLKDSINLKYSELLTKEISKCNLI